MKNLLLTIFSLLLVVSCSERQEAEVLFARAEQALEEHPDSAFAMLDSASGLKDSWSRATQMRYELLRAKAQNKAYIDFTTDSVMADVACYYDSHGTPNDQMEAHYLLGCTYRDMHESPMALSCYLDATEKADTLSDDCDYGMLMRIWGQIADCFEAQLMPHKELEALEMYRKYALVNGDSLNFIIGTELDRRPYFLLGDTTNAINSAMHAYNLFIEKGYIADAAITLSSLVPQFVSSNDTLKARQAMMFFEQESGLFNGDTIAAGKEVYYISKASYYLAVNKLDSAEHYYRKLFKYGYDYDACKGLMKVFASRNGNDSTSRYSLLMEDALEKQFTTLHTQAMFNADGMFNYSRNQRIAMEKEMEAERTRLFVYFIFVSVICVLILCIKLFLKYKSKQKEEIYKLNNQLILTKADYENAKADYCLMEANYESYKVKKSEELQKMLAKLEELSLQYEVAHRTTTISEMQNKKAVKDVLDHTKITAGCEWVEISNGEWDALFDEFKNDMPYFYASVIGNAILSDQEQKIAALIMLKLHTNDIAYILNSSPANISNAKTSINKKLFCHNSAKGLYDNLAKVH